MTYDEFKKRYRYEPTNDLLGEGAFGKVFRATDTESGSTVAIKVAPVNTANESHSLKHEFETVGKVAPHLHIALYDECYRFAVEWAGLHDFAILEYYPLGSLDKLIKNQSLTATDKHDLAVGILEGLRHLHNTGAQGVVHRDLKPRNVLIQKWGGKYVPKITDFGLSKFSDSVSNSVISQSFKGGTLNYASPEQIKGEQIRRNTDLWAFGVILHEIMTGEVPYKIDDSSESTLRQVYDRMNQQTLPDSFKGVKEPYATIIRKCLVVNPNQRYRTADEVLLDLTQTATPPPPLTSPPLVAEEKKETKAQEAIKDQTEIFEDSPFASFGNLVEETNAKPPVASPDDEAKPILKAHLTSNDPVKSAPLPKEKPKKDFTPIIVGVVVLLGIITATVLYLGHDTPQTTLIPKDTTQSTPSKEITAVVDTLLLGQQADSLFNLPNYPQYAQTILKINEAFPQTKGQHTTQTAIQKLEKGAASWEKYSLTDDDVRSFLTAFSEALLFLDSTNAKGLALKEKLKK